MMAKEIGHIMREKDVVEAEELFGVAERQRPQHRGIDRAEHRRSRADAEAEHYDDRRGVAGALPWSPRCVADILARVVEQGEPPDVATRFLDCERIAESTPRTDRGIFTRCAAGAQRLLAQLPVQPHFLFELARGAIASQQ